MKIQNTFLPLIGAAYFSLGGLLHAELPDLSKMNILILCPEDWTTEAIGVYGNEEVITPNLDRFAKQSTLFEKAYCQSPICNPSRTSFNTGLRPETTNVYSNPEKYDENVPEWATTLAGALVDAPIQTFMVGKLFHHNWDAVEATSVFDGIFQNPPAGYEGRKIRYSIPRDTPPNPPKDWVHSPDPVWEARMIEAMKIREELWADTPKGSEQWNEGRRVFQDLSAEQIGDSGDIEERNPDGIRARVVANLIEEFGKNGEQFLITFGSSRPHTPLRAPQKYFDMYDADTLTLTPAQEELDRNIPDVAKRFGNNWDIFKIREANEKEERAALHAYYACATFIDDQIGLILEALEEAGLSDNTIVFFTSDHGFHLGEHGMWSKLSLFEQSTRVPLIVRIPGVTEGERTDAIVELVDLYPTILDILQIEPPHDKLEGISFLPVIEDPEREWKQAAFTTIRQGRFLGRSVRTDTLRYSEYVDYDDRNDEDAVVRFTELYDLSVDPWEQNNLAGTEDYEAEQKRLAALLNEGWTAALPPGMSSR